MLYLCVRVYLFLLNRLSAHATLPTRGSAGAAGYDLSSAKDVLVPARGKALCPTDLSIALPAGVYGRIAPRSGLAWKHSIDAGAGVIDEGQQSCTISSILGVSLFQGKQLIDITVLSCMYTDYRGNVGVLLFNHSDADFQVKTGDRVAQLILERIAIAEVEEVQDLEATYVSL